MPSCCSSQTVRRAPCSHGRVSPAKTLAMRCWAMPARITPSAVPNPAVASEPVLQWVSTPLPASIRPAPSAPMWRLAARSSSAMAWASVASTCCQSAPARASARRMRASAQARLTAVGRDALSRCRAGSSLASACAPSSACTPAAASTTPQAAAMPIAGAPRTVSAWMASATASLSRHSTCSTTNGSLRWSSNCRVSPVHRIGRIWS